jgi:hypothetical protein
MDMEAIMPQKDVRISMSHLDLPTRVSAFEVITVTTDMCFHLFYRF